MKRGRPSKGVITGVYKIVSPDGSTYIGQSKNLRKRIIKHNAKKGNDTGLRHSVTQYGWEAHKIEIIQECPHSITTRELINLETYYIKLYIDTGVKLVNKNNLPKAMRNMCGNIKVYPKLFDPLHNWTIMFSC